MNVIFNKTLYRGFLRRRIGEEEMELDPIITIILLDNKNQFVNYEGNFISRVRTLYNYFSIYTLSDIIYKIRSRLAEAIRNDKYLTMGVGRNSQGECYLYINPVSQFYQSSVVIPFDLLLPIHLDNLVLSSQERYICDFVNNATVYVDKSLFKSLDGYSIYSGRTIPDVDRSVALKEVKRVIDLIAPSLTCDFLVSSYYKKELKIERAKGNAPRGKKSAVLFGYGNYAKSVALPYLSDYIVAERIHEVDPVQLLNCSFAEMSTSPVPDFDRSFDVWLIAGYHHTHVELALEAFKRNAVAIIEKPVATNRVDFAKFSEFVSTARSVFFVCFQKRYLSFNQYIFSDFKIRKGDGINYRAIVYEIPLDNHHWYNWPNSGSRIISNGCHWIDHFFYLNDFCETEDYWARKVSRDTILCYIKLTNGAVFSLTLTDSGSKRQGVREYLELSVDGYRAVIRDSMYYESESNVATIRRARISKLQSLKDMYRCIGKSIASRGPGDEIRTLKSCEVSIVLDEMLTV